MRAKRCDICGRRHYPLDTAIGYDAPAHFFLVPEDERERRVKISPDLCQVDDEFFLIRGVAEIPFTDAEGCFEWGLWALISKASFERALELWEVDEPNEPPFAGRISGEPPGYDGLMEHPCRVQLVSATQRPLITLEPSDHLMYREQRDGIPVKRMHDIQFGLAPDLFK